MSHLLSALLETWPYAWRHASLWRAVTGAQADSTVDRVARCVVESLAHPRSALEVWREVLDQEDFDAAEALIDLEDFVLAAGQEHGRARLDLDRQLRQARLRKTARQRAQQWLNAHGHVVAPASGQLAATRRLMRAWPYDEPIDVICRMLLGQSLAYPGMLERWAPAEDDIAARSLLEYLYFVPEGLRSGDREPVELFVAALETFLECPVQPGPPESHLEGGFVVSVIRGLHVPWIPALSEWAHPIGLPLVVPSSEVQPEDPPPQVTTPFLFFDPARILPSVPHGGLRIVPEFLFALMRDASERRDQVQRMIGSQLRSTLALPSAWLLERRFRAVMSDQHRLLHAGENVSTTLLGGSLRDLFEALNVPTQHDTAIELLAFYAGGIPAVAWRLTERVLKRIDSGSSMKTSLTQDIVIECWLEREMHTWLEQQLRASVPLRSAADSVLSALLEDALTVDLAGGFSALRRSDIIGYVQADFPAESDVIDALDELIKLGLVRSLDGGRYGLVDGGPIWLLLDNLADQST